jgi:hypothetical protein
VFICEIRVQKDRDNAGPLNHLLFSESVVVFRARIGWKLDQTSSTIGMKENQASDNLTEQLQNDYRLPTHRGSDPLSGRKLS